MIDNVSQVVDEIITEAMEQRVFYTNTKNEDVEVPKVLLHCISKAKLMLLMRTTLIEDSEIK